MSSPQGSSIAVPDNDSLVPQVVQDMSFDSVPVQAPTLRRRALSGPTTMYAGDLRQTHFISLLLLPLGLAPPPFGLVLGPLLALGFGIHPLEPGPNFLGPLPFMNAIISSACSGNLSHMAPSNISSNLLPSSSSSCAVFSSPTLYTGLFAPLIFWTVLT